MSFSKNSSHVRELFSEGKIPFGGMSNVEVVEAIHQGRRLSKPDIMIDSLYELLLQCWDIDASNRPNLSEIFDELDHWWKKVNSSEVKGTHVQLEDMSESQAIYN
jgi:hypothetical protein